MKSRRPANLGAVLGLVAVLTVAALPCRPASAELKPVVRDPVIGILVVAFLAPSAATVIVDSVAIHDRARPSTNMRIFGYFAGWSGIIAASVLVGVGASEKPKDVSFLSLGSIGLALGATAVTLTICSETLPDRPAVILAPMPVRGGAGVAIAAGF